MEKCPVTGKNCLKYKAYTITNIRDEKVNTINVCEDCLSQMEDEIHIKNKENNCEFCGLTIDEFFKKAKLGCAKCYDKFEKHIILILEKIHKSKQLKHTGSAPEFWKRQQAENFDNYKFLLMLKQKLAISVKNENYKEASKIKNTIKDFDLLIEELSADQNNDNVKKQICDYIFNYLESEQ